MGKHRVKQDPGGRIRPLPSLKSTVRVRRRAVDIWYKQGFSAAVATIIPNLVLLALGRMDLIMYTSAGTMCALYAHGQPYAARARSVAWVVAGVVGSMTLGLVCAAYIDSVALLVLLSSLVAAVHKMFCDATRIGPPGNVVMTFIASTAFFVPQQAGDIPFHALLAVGGGVIAWLVCMAPGLVRPRGPERLATARALEAAAALLEAGPEAARQEPGPLRRGAAAAVNAAWQTVLQVPARTAKRAADRAALEKLLIRAESALAAHTGTEPAEEAARCATWAAALRSGGPLPRIRLSAAEAGELAGIEAERVAAGDRSPETDPVTGYVPRRPLPGHRAGIRGTLARMAPGSPLLPIGARAALGCTLAGWVSMAVGVGHPYWAVVSASAVYMANISLSWQRMIQRILGNIFGLILFIPLVPLMRIGPVAMILLVAACQIGAEAFISRNYWLGSVCVTPMALLLSEFGGSSPAGELILDRSIDTVLGAVIGLLCCALVTNRRATRRIGDILGRVEGLCEEAQQLLAPGAAYDREAEARLRDRLAATLVELREAVDVAAGEWWQDSLPEERIARAEREGHRELARLVRRLTPPVMAA